MKVGILTFPHSPSHGCSLQMFALYTKLTELGADAEIIYYSPDTLIHNKKKHLTAKQRLAGKLARYLVKSPKPAFERFEAKLKMSHDQPIKTFEELQVLAQCYDRIIVGSDQVWNPVVTGGDLSYYLKFSAEANRNATYAPSFGIDKVVDDREEITALLKNIKYLSAREVQGQRIIKELTDRDVPLVLDPTMLLDSMMWQTQETIPALYKKPYVLYYTIKPSPQLLEYAARFAKAHGCILVPIGGRLSDAVSPFKYNVFDAGPAEFLGLCHGAAYVITNSFHGTVFSILYHKKFLVEYSSDTNSRLTNLIELLGLSPCVADATDTTYRITTPDYDAVERILGEQRTHSTSYLRTIIEE